MPPKQTAPPDIGIILADCNQLGLEDLKLLREALDLIIAKKEYQKLCLEDKHAQHLNTLCVGARVSKGYIAR